jgi:polar amino acid transport system substrate-binding protein
MKRYPIIFVMVCLASLLMASCAKSPPVKVRFGTDASYPPFETIDISKKQMTGFDLELMKAIAAKANLEVEFVNTGYNKVLEGVAQCQFDGAISAIAISDELSQQMSFSEPYFSIGQVVVVKSGNATITGRDTLAGMTVGAQKGTNSASELAKINGVTVKLYASPDILFQEMINGLIDAAIADKMVALSYANNSANELKIVGDEFAVENYGIAICNQKPDLLKQVNDGLKAVKSNGTFNKLSQKWLKNPVID